VSKPRPADPLGPDAQREGGARLKPLGSPKRATRVIVDDAGEPIAVVTGRRNARPKRVAAVRERWRIDDEWWRRPLAREYLTVVLEDGRPLTLYLDRIEGGWWVQGEEG
jgi:hypothetical protein